MTRKQIEKAAEEAGWDVTITKRVEGGYDIEFQMYTNFGQDVNESFVVRTLDDIKHEVYERYQNFDINEEAAIWIGPDGHGHNGAPHNIDEILDDMKEVERALESLFLTLSGHHLPDPNKVDFAGQAESLRDSALFALMSNIHKAYDHPGYNAKAFKNPNKCSKYEEIVYLLGKWVLLDGDGLQYSVRCMPLEELCEMVDGILNE